ncbi:B3 domain-containing protein REM16 [Ricinus communis]|uniref:DNA binding protein, putative n=1 Tax=Ricinus communis TaxID=3988 RepID=B9R7J9_RICCO|nr:B3 domain-containing protein REM16 [Ricinus communis]XP_015574771.1 B3 domain-containing protein REM16 [Ricinus communis]EEF52479.1 DNA binding protein, putative [Ricinus communis]|eukprot:XP_002510292.1 B3 domain-containing protein REM16 [Ricinus communis]
MKEGACADCRSWEEKLYWMHFQYIYFCQFLLAGFNQRLAIPEKFTRNLRRKLRDTVTLKSPCGTAWEVCLTAHENTLFFDHGWREFVEYHSLEENDILVFKYNGESSFDVLMFDGQSMCEKAGSYFLAKRTHKGYNSTGYQSKRKTGESSAEVLSALPVDGNGGSPLKKPRHHNFHTTLGRPLISRAVNNKARREIKFKTPIDAPKTARKKEPYTWAEDAEAKADTAHDKAKLKVCQSAQAAVTSEGFIAVMKPTHVSKKFFMSIPSSWVSEHITCQENQYVILRIKEKTWQVRLYYRKRPNRGGLACGWKSFVLDNNIQEFDVCVFEPGNPLDNTMVLDVNIFRVVQDMNPHTPASLTR